jgi:hypothetical protein
VGKAIGDLIQRGQRGRVRFSRPFERAPPGCNLGSCRGNDRNGSGSVGTWGLSRVFPF